MKHQLARLLVRAYPPAWRGRYADEVLALLEDTGVTVGGLADLARGAVGEQVRTVYRQAFGAPSERAVLIWRSVAHAALVLAIGLGLRTLGLWTGDGLAAGRQRISMNSWLLFTLPMALGMLRVAAVLVVGGLYRARGGALPPSGIGVGGLEMILWLLTIPLDVVGRIIRAGSLELAVADEGVRIGRYVFFLALLSVTSQVRLANESRIAEILMKPGPQSAIYGRPILGLSEPTDPGV